MSIVQKAIPVTIAAGASLSSGALLGDSTICAVYFPTGWTTAAITWQVSFDDGNTWVELGDATGAPVSLPASAVAATYYTIDPRNASFTGVTMLKLRSGTAGAPVTQAAAQVVKVITRRMYYVPS
jgi:hypothetical protein